ncbi:MAG: lipid IV(A) 3-deoxy-D-manno-octulosonic acid transferase [Gammaproteobacteria bacterium]|nr:lipid IV(A) 3-deoxy-D-manno-octulosonic acid transferase [Gammaproteobacteria bacterium]
MRKRYSLFIYLITPLVLLYLVFRGLRDRAYLRRWPERFGFIHTPSAAGSIVVHAVSMGEVNAASALVTKLTKRYPGIPLCLTCLTPTGSARIRALFGDAVSHVYIPLDLPGAVRRFFDRADPRLVIIMETEIWPNLYHEAHRRKIPLLIVNARISDNSFGNYRRFRKLIAAPLSRVSHIAAQSRQDAARLAELGANETRLSVSGNLKFDVRLPPSLLEQGDSIRSAWGTDRLVLLAGSTHEADEGVVLEAFSGLLKTFPAALLVLVPRHPERFGRAEQLARSAGLRVSLRSTGASCARSTQCFVIDTMGELLRYYAACDVAFVGGSIDPIGGHNVLEPAALSRPVVVGPHTFNFAEITQALIESEAAVRIKDAAELEQAVARLFTEPELRDRMGRSGRELVRSGQGALNHTLELLEAVITPTTD